MHTLKINRERHRSGAIVDGRFEDVFPRIIDADDVESGSEGGGGICGIGDAEGYGGVEAVGREQLELVPGTAEHGFGGVGAEGYEIGLFGGRMVSLGFFISVGGRWFGIEDDLRSIGKN